MFNSILKSFTLLMFFFLLVGCNSQKKEVLKADNQLLIIENLIEINALNAAKLKIDSFHTNFRNLVDKRKIASALEDTITRRECRRTLVYCDSIYPIKKHEFDSITQYFRFEKDTVYEQFGNYTHKSQLTEQNSNRNYLKCIVDENARLKLISNYTGTKIAHIGIEVRSGDFFAESDTTNKMNYSEHYYNNGGYYFERVTIENQAAEDIVNFIFNNNSSVIQVTLKGKSNYKYRLTNVDIKAISASYHLWIVKKDVIKLEKEIQKSNIKIQKINFRNN